MSSLWLFSCGVLTSATAFADRPCAAIAWSMRDDGGSSFGNEGPVDIAGLTVSNRFNGMLPQPVEPKFKIAIINVSVRSHPYGGTDKSSNGCRYDNIAVANGMINNGRACQAPAPTVSHPHF